MPHKAMMPPAQTFRPVRLIVWAEKCVRNANRLETRYALARLRQEQPPCKH